MLPSTCCYFKFIISILAMSWVWSPDKCQVTMHNLENSPPLFSSFFHYVHSLWTFSTTIFYYKKETPISLERVRKDLGTLLESWTISRRYWLGQPSNNNNNACAQTFIVRKLDHSSSISYQIIILENFSHIQTEDRQTG